MLEPGRVGSKDVRIKIVMDEARVGRWAIVEKGESRLSTINRLLSKGRSMPDWLELRRHFVNEFLTRHLWSIVSFGGQTHWRRSFLEGSLF